MSWEEINRQLALLESYFSQNYHDAEGNRVDKPDPQGYVVLVLDADAALKGGISPEAVALARELAEFQNALMIRAFRAGTANITKVEIDIEDYPLVSAYFDEAAERARDGSK